MFLLSYDEVDTNAYVDMQRVCIVTIQSFQWLICKSLINLLCGYAHINYCKILS